METKELSDDEKLIRIAEFAGWKRALVIDLAPDGREVCGVNVFPPLQELDAEKKEGGE